jgi:hypothetical protein
MNRIRRPVRFDWGSILGRACAPVLASIVLVAPLEAAAIRIPAAAGTQAVGTTRFVWTDLKRADPTRQPPRRGRELIVQLWYPTTATTGRPAPYVLELDALGPRFREVFELSTPTLASVETGAWLDAPIALDGAPFPLVVFSHGLGTPRSCYTTYVRNLAAAGYVVAAIDHPGMGLVAFPDGDVVSPFEPWTKPAPGLRDRSEAERDAYWRPGRTQLSLDQRFVIDEVARLAAPHSGSKFAGRIDVKRVAMAGHSDGFLSATCRDTRVRAAINLAGVPALAERRRGLRIPLLTIHDASGSPTQTAIVATMRAPAYDLYLRGSDHNSATDLGLFDDSTATSAARRLEILGAYSAGFLDFALRGRSVPLLVPTKSPYPEAVFTWYGPKP